MPIRKFRDVSEMEQSLWYERNDPALPRAIAGVWNFAARICPLQFPRGVHKYRSIEEANADRDRWEEANFQAFQERKRTGALRLSSVSSSTPAIAALDSSNRPTCQDTDEVVSIATEPKRST